MTNGQFDRGGQLRKPECQVTQREMDIACFIQAVTEEIILSQLIHSVREKYDVVAIETSAAGNSADVCIIAARPQCHSRCAPRRARRADGRCTRGLLGIVHNEG